MVENSFSLLIFGHFSRERVDVYWSLRRVSRFNFLYGAISGADFGEEERRLKKVNYLNIIFCSNVLIPRKRKDGMWLEVRIRLWKKYSISKREERWSNLQRASSKKTVDDHLLSVKSRLAGVPSCFNRTRSRLICRSVLVLSICNTFSISSIHARRSMPKSMNDHSMPSFVYSSCSRTNMWWLKNCCSFSLVKLMQSCSKLLNYSSKGQDSGQFYCFDLCLGNAVDCVFFKGQPCWGFICLDSFLGLFECSFKFTWTSFWIFDVLWLPLSWRATSPGYRVLIYK